jgi:hypothetical protein
MILDVDQVRVIEPFGPSALAKCVTGIAASRRGAVIQSGLTDASSLAEGACPGKEHGGLIVR